MDCLVSIPERDLRSHLLARGCQPPSAVSEVSIPEKGFEQVVPATPSKIMIYECVSF